jgi:hypothetical protein
MTEENNKTWIELIIKTKTRSQGLEETIMIDIKFDLDQSIEDWVYDNYETKYEEVVDFKWKELSQIYIDQKEKTNYDKSW